MFIKTIEEGEVVVFAPERECVIGVITKVFEGSQSGLWYGIMQAENGRIIRAGLDDFYTEEMLRKRVSATQETADKIQEAAQRLRAKAQAQGKESIDERA